LKNFLLKYFSQSDWWYRENEAYSARKPFRGLDLNEVPSQCKLSLLCATYELNGSIQFLKLIRILVFGQDYPCVRLGKMFLVEQDLSKMQHGVERISVFINIYLLTRIYL
jgi:hypothetical protein